MLREKEKYRAICIYPKRIAAFDVENLEETRRYNTVKGERERFFHPSHGGNAEREGKRRKKEEK